MYGIEYQQKINTLTDNSFKENSDNMIRYITNFIDEKTKDFDEYTDNLQSLGYKIIFPLLRRDFLFKTIIHLNNELLKNDAGFMIDINITTNSFFNEQINKHWDYYCYYDLQTKNNATQYLKSLITDYSQDEFLETYTKIENNLPVICLNIPHIHL